MIIILGLFRFGSLFKFLLQKGALVNAKAEYKITPLHISTNNGNMEMISLLLENGANIEAFAKYPHATHGDHRVKRTPLQVSFF